MLNSNFETDHRIVMTLDAGGTNFIFSAIKAATQIVKPIRLNPNANHLKKCLETIIEGFEKVKELLKEKPSAISFAFPGPADYSKGIIGDLQNLPAFKGGVALGPMLEEHFGIPVFINNDGNLYALGESLFGFLPKINRQIKKTGSIKQFKNLIGITLGTGFGVGLSCNNQIIKGDNSTGGEGWLLRNILKPDYHVEEHLSREGIRRVFAEKSNLALKDVGVPQEIYNIAIGSKEGNKKAALETFYDFGVVLGEALANIITLFDGLVVIGGGVSGAYNLFAPAMFEQLESKFLLNNGGIMDRLAVKVFNLEDQIGLSRLLKGQQIELLVPNTNKKVIYDPFIRSGIGVSKNNTSYMIALGSYAFALKRL
ncbi:MAG: ROK family protein [Polaribacter sp.]